MSWHIPPASFLNWRKTTNPLDTRWQAPTANPSLLPSLRAIRAKVQVRPAPKSPTTSARHNPNHTTQPQMPTTNANRTSHTRSQPFRSESHQFSVRPRPTSFGDNGEKKKGSSSQRKSLSGRILPHLHLAIHARPLGPCSSSETSKCN